jgi:DNA-binding NtrC family response regulator
MSRSRSTAAELGRLLDDAHLPIYVVDDLRRIVYCNPACAAWIGAKAAALVDQRCAYHSPSETDGLAALVAGLCPPPKVFCGQPQDALVSCQRPPGGQVFRRGHFWPLAAGHDESAPVIAVLDAVDCPPPAETSEGTATAMTSDDDLHAKVRRFRQSVAGRYRAEGLIGVCPTIVRARAQLELAAGSRVNVLISGPAGAGKTHVARTIHYSGSDPGGLVPLDCAVLESELLRAQLRALRRKGGVSKTAASTLHLVSVDMMPAEVQVELADMLRADTLPMRICATSPRLLTALADEGHFSRSLACALSTIVIELPPLCQRSDDVPLLAQLFLEEANAASVKQVGGFSPEALDALAAYAWPGNVDELASLMREAHERATGAEVNVKDLPKRIHLAADAAARPPRVDEPIVLEQFLARVERELIIRALRRAKGNKSWAARLLGLTRPRLYRRLVQLGLEPPGAEASK